MAVIGFIAGLGQNSGPGEEPGLPAEQGQGGDGAGAHAGSAGERLGDRIQSGSGTRIHPQSPRMDQGGSLTNIDGATP